MKPRTLKTKMTQSTVDKVVRLVDDIADDAYCVECKGAEIEQFLINTACRLQMIEAIIYTRAQK